MTMRSGQRRGPGGLWLLLVPAACCGGPLLLPGLAAAGALAWGGLGLAGAALVIWRRRRACAAGGVSSRPGSPSRPVPGLRCDDHQQNAAGTATASTAGPGLAVTGELAGDMTGPMTLRGRRRGRGVRPARPV